MLRLKKEPQQTSYLWLGQSLFIQRMLRSLQKGLDASGYDIRLGFRDRCSFPKRYWSIHLAFSDAVMKRTVEELDEDSEEMVRQFEESKGYKRAIRLLTLFTEDARNSAVEVDVSYAVSSCCKAGVPGVIVYWKK